MAKFEKGKALFPNDIITYQEDGIVSMELLHNESGSITLFAFGKGQQLSPHSAPLDAFIQATDGQFILTLDDEEHLVKTGDIFMIPAGHVHSLRADDKFKMIITMIAANRKIDFKK
jgi:quercetin dioxygenase-like cupin family protein